MTNHAATRIEQVVRDSYGRLLALLASRCGDISTAEDALGDAFIAALESWPNQGVPDHPDAWLMTAAKHRLIDQSRRSQTRERAVELLLREAELKQDRTMDAVETDYPDERLRLMLVCTHPAIDPAVRTPLILQTVLGVTADRIASVFMVKPSAMGARLGRAKSKIRDARIPFVIPSSEELPSRLTSLLEAIYAAFTIGLDLEGLGASSGLKREAIWLASIVVQRLECTQAAEDSTTAFSLAESEALLAMMLFRAARDQPTGQSRRYIPLSEQPTNHWNEKQIHQAEVWLRKAARTHQVGPYQLEAAIQSVHCERRRTGRTNWQAIEHLYQGLLKLNPTAATRIGLASAQYHCGEPQAALQTLEGVPDSFRVHSASYWAVSAFAHRALNSQHESNSCYDRAIGLTESETVRAWLLQQRSG